MRCGKYEMIKKEGESRLKIKAKQRKTIELKAESLRGKSADMP